MIRLSIFILGHFALLEAANVLFISILTSPSHHIWNSVLYNELAVRGHNVTVISQATNKNSPNGVHHLHLENIYNEESAAFYKGKLVAAENTNPLIEVFFSQDTVDFCESLSKSGGFSTLLNYPDDFKVDLVIHDFTGGPCLLPFVHKFGNPPLISVSAFSFPSFTTSLMGGHHYYAYIPHNRLLSDDNINFWQMLYNFILYTNEYLVRQNFLVPKIDEVSAKSFGPGLPSVGDIERKTALAFVSTNPAMDYHTPLPENVIPVGGLHIKDPKPVPKKFKEFIDTSKKGFVVVSLGTNFQSDFIPESKRQIFLDVFSELPDYNFIWKFESNIPSVDLPKNVQIHSWLPVSDLLADPKIKAVFFHGGLLTTQEAFHRGVPMIIMPFILDQQQNLIRTKGLGIAEGVDYYTLSEDGMRNALVKVLEDPSYVHNALKWSARFRDQKEKPLDRAVWWIEWVLRNPDCDYLKSPVLRLGFIAGNAFDVEAFVLLCCLVIFIVLIKGISLCICRRKGIQQKNNRKNVNMKKQQ